MVDVVHIGLPKCASNLLQRSALVNHPEIACITPKLDPDWVDPVGRFLALNSQKSMPAFVSKVQRADWGGESVVRVLSQEGFSGDMITGSCAYIYPKLLKESFGEVKIILIIREQISYVSSAWRQQVRLGLGLGLSSFVRWSGELKQNYGVGNPSANLLNRLNFLDFVECLYDLFGQRSVHVALLEDIQTDPLKTLNAMYKFMNVAQVDEIDTAIFNQGIKHPEIQAVWNVLCRSSFPNGVFQVLPSRWRKLVQKLPGNSGSERTRRNTIQKILGEAEIEKIRLQNKELQVLLDVDLGRRGYLI